MSEQSKRSLEDRVVDWFYNNRTVLIGGPVAVVIIGLAVVGFKSLQTRNEMKIQAEFFKVETDLEKKIDQFMKEEEEAQTPAADKSAKDKKAAAAKVTTPKKEKTPELFKERFQVEIAELSRIADQYQGTNAATMAAVRLAGLAQEYKDRDLALKTVTSALNKVDKDSVYFGILHGQMALILTEQNNCKDAILHYDQILNNKAQTAFYSQSLLRKGVCHMELKEWDAASKTFEQVEKDHADTGASYSAKNFKRLVLLRQGQSGT